MYRHLDADKTIATLHRLKNRVEERFPQSSLAGVCGDLCEMAGETRTRTGWIARPHYPARLAVALVVLVSVGLIGFGIAELVQALEGRFGIVDLVMVTESALNELVVVGAALLFLFSMETRIKRTRALTVLHELRAMAHVIDMHQLTKDPSQILGPAQARTKSSPQRTLTPFQLTRYLDYCSEMLSLVGKLAALYAQSLPDMAVVSAVNEIETLTNSLSRKVWQKIMMLDADPALKVTPDDAATDSGT